MSLFELSCPPLTFRSDRQAILSSTSAFTNTNMMAVHVCKVREEWEEEDTIIN
jgi:hypothetical protein